MLPSPRGPALGRQHGGGHGPDSRRKLQAAILDRTGAEVRQVWRPGRRSLACPRPLREPALRGSAAEVCRLADEVAKRRRKGQQNPAGARTSGLRWDEQRHRSAHRGGAPGRRTRVSKAGANAARSAGMSGSRRKRGVWWRKAPDRTAGCLSVKPSWGKPPGRNVRGGGWKRGRWSDEAPAPPSKAWRAETPDLRLRAPVLSPTGEAGHHVLLEGKTGRTPCLPTVFPQRQQRAMGSPVMRHTGCHLGGEPRAQACGS